MHRNRPLNTKRNPCSGFSSKPQVKGRRSMILGVCFTNFGPYHLARLRALAKRLQQQGDHLLAYEVASSEQTYPWERSRQSECFEWITLFPNRTLEALSSEACASALVQALDRDQPDYVAVAGYARPESVAAARWARRNQRRVILMSESQRTDRPRVWWKELVKRRRVRLFHAALVGGPSHRDYLIDLGMPEPVISLGYNAVDNAYYQRQADLWRLSVPRPSDLPDVPYFLSVSRFVSEKNLPRLIEAFACYRDRALKSHSWDLVLCGDGALFPGIQQLISKSRYPSAIHCPGFLQSGDLARWYAYASAFVLPSISEPWGLVANEAASVGLPLLISNRAGCVKHWFLTQKEQRGLDLTPWTLSN